MGTLTKRLYLWQSALHMIRDYPWFGVGMNVVRDYPFRYDLQAYRKYGVFLHFHSTPIEIGVELGLLVLSAWIALMGAYWLMLARLVTRSRKLDDPFPYGLSLGILGATSAFLVSCVPN